MNEPQDRYDRVLAALNAAENEPTDDDAGADEDIHVTGGLNPWRHDNSYSLADLIQQYRSGAGSPHRGEFVKPGR